MWQHPRIQKKLSTTWSIFNTFDFEEIFNKWEEVSLRQDDRFVVNHGLVYYPNYFGLRYLEKEQKEEIVDRVNDFYYKNKDYKLFKTNHEFVQGLLSIKEFMGGKYEDHDAVCRERTRVLRMYDTVRGTDYKSLFPFIKDYE